jgi:hypothetical protein
LSDRCLQSLVIGKIPRSPPGPRETQFTYNPIFREPPLSGENAVV